MGKRDTRIKFVDIDIHINNIPGSNTGCIFMVNVPYKEEAYKHYVIVDILAMFYEKCIRDFSYLIPTSKLISISQKLIPIIFIDYPSIQNAKKFKGWKRFKFFLDSFKFESCSNHFHDSLLFVFTNVEDGLTTDYVISELYGNI